MGLFKLTNDIATVATGDRPSSYLEPVVPSEFALGRDFVDLREQLRQIKNLGGQLIHFCSEGRFSGHELMLYLLKEVVGPCPVHIATWKISETPARLLTRAMDQGLITELNMLLERRMTIKSPNALQLMQHNATTIGMGDVHAKVCVLDHPEHPVVIVMSANFSRNRRIESGVIHHSRRAAFFHRSWIQKHIKSWQRNQIQ